MENTPQPIETIQDLYQYVITLQKSGLIYPEMRLKLQFSKETREKIYKQILEFQDVKGDAVVPEAHHHQVTKGEKTFSFYKMNVLGTYVEIW